MNRQPLITLDPDDIKWYRQQKKRSMIRSVIALLTLALPIAYLLLPWEGVRFSGTLLLTLAGIAGAGIRIAWLEWRLRNRLVCLQSAEEQDSIAFYDEIDDYCAWYEVRRSAAYILVLMTAPVSLISVLFQSYADAFSIAAAMVFSVAGFINIAKRLDGWLK